MTVYQWREDFRNWDPAKVVGVSGCPDAAVLSQLGVDLDDQAIMLRVSDAVPVREYSGVRRGDLYVLFLDDLESGDVARLDATP
jgi:hypothetical protein